MADSDNETLQALQNQNAILEEQLQLFTKQQNLAKLFFPTIPEGLAGTFDLKGDFVLEGISAAYETLKLIALQWCWRLNGGKTDDADVQRLAELRCSREKDGGRRDFEECIEREKRAIAANSPKGAAVTLRKVVIVREQEINALLELQAFMEKLRQLESRLKAVVEPSDGKPIEGDAFTALPAGLPLIAPAVEAALNIARLFKTNVEITTTTVEVDDVALVAAVADELKRDAKVDVFYPPAFPPHLSSTGTTDLLAALNRIDAAMEKLIALISTTDKEKGGFEKNVEDAVSEIKTLDASIAELSAQLDRLTKSGGSESDIRQLEERIRARKAEKAEAERKKAAAEGAGKRVTELLKALKQLRDLVDAFRGDLLREASGGGASPLASLLKTEKLARLLAPGQGVQVMQAKLHRAGASTKSKTTFFGGAKMSVGGGAVASFILYDAESGQILASGVFAEKRRFKPLE